MSRDAEKAKKFYGDTVGWTYKTMPMENGTYWVAKMGNDIVGGLFPLFRSDVARRRKSQEILRRHRRLDLQNNADGERHLLGGEDGQRHCWRAVSAHLAAVRDRKS